MATDDLTAKKRSDVRVAAIHGAAAPAHDSRTGPRRRSLLSLQKRRRNAASGTSGAGAGTWLRALTASPTECRRNTTQSYTGALCGGSRKLSRSSPRTRTQRPAGHETGRFLLKCVSDAFDAWRAELDAAISDSDDERHRGPRPWLSGRARRSGQVPGEEHLLGPAAGEEGCGLTRQDRRPRAPRMAVHNSGRPAVVRLRSGGDHGAVGRLCDARLT
jgi:hypothetical protein